MIEARINGLPELSRALSTVALRMQRNVMRGAMRAAATVVLDAARVTTAFSDDTGELRKSLRVSTRLRRDVASAKVKTDVFYAPMVERGVARHIIRIKDENRPKRVTRRGIRLVSTHTINRKIKGGEWAAEGDGVRGSLVINGRFIGPAVVHPGVQKRPFLRPALDANIMAAVNAAREYIRRRLAEKSIDVPGSGDYDDQD